MSKWNRWITYSLLLGFILLGIKLIFQESPDKAYERGYIEGERHIYHIWLEKGYIPTDSNDTDDIWYSDTFYTKRDSLAAISDSIYFDSTDTMPAVERGKH